MFGLRSSRSAGAGASGGVDGSSPASVTSTATLVANSASRDSLNMMKERLQRLQDEESWQEAHTKQVISYNKTSVLFWILCSASLCFASLNAYHGWTSSGGSSAYATAIIIGLLYFTIEFTVPVSAHLASWGSRGQARFMVRAIGLTAYSLAVVFSLSILQGKFSSSADSASARAEAAAVVFASDKESLSSARETIAKLKERVGTRSSESVIAEMRNLIAQPINRRETLGDTTGECQGSRRTARERELCSQYDALRRLHADAISFENAKKEVAKSVSNLTDTGRVTTRTADVQNRVIARLLGISLESVSLYKASLIATIAALLTHLLWAAHGHVVNQSIAKARDSHFERRSLERAVIRETEVEKLQRIANEEKARVEAAQTATAFMAARGGAVAVAGAIQASTSRAPINEQPVLLQVQRYFTDRAIMGSEYTMQVGIFHDDYCLWCKNNGLAHVPVDRFVANVKDAGLVISPDGRVVGAALRS